MKRILFLMVLSVSVSGYGQMLTRVKEYSISGTDKISRQDYTGAISDLTKAIKLDSTFKQAYENRGVARFYLQDYQGAIDDYTKALTLDPDDYSTSGRRGWAKFYLHDYQGAISDLDKAVEGSKDKFRYINFRGEAKFRLRDFKGAEEDFSSVIDSRSVDREQRNKALYWRGMIKVIEGEKESGCTDLKQAAKSGNKEAKKAIEQNCNN